MSKTEVSGKQVKDGSIELVDLSTALSNTISGKAEAADVTALDTRVTAVESDVAALQSASAPNLSDLGEVSITSPSSGQVLKYNGTGWANAADSTFSGSYTDLTNKPTLFSGSYTDLTNKPTIPSALDDLSDVTISSPSNDQVLKYNGTAWVNSAAPSSFSGSYTDLTNKPTLASFTTLTSPSSGQVLTYNGSDWINQSLTAANGSTPGIVSASAQSFNGLKSFTQGASIKAPWIDQVAFRVQPYNASQTGSLIYVENTSGGEAFSVAPTGATAVTLASASAKGLVVKGAASQTANLLEVQNSSASSLFSVDKDGLITAYGFKTTAGGGVSVTGLGTGTSSYSSAGVHLNANQSAYGVIDLVGNNGGFIDFAAINEDFHGRMLYDRGQHGYYFYSRADATPKVCIDREGYGTLFAQPHSAAVKGIIVQAAASQTANLLEVQNSSGTALFSVSSAGNATINGIAAGTSGVSTATVFAADSATALTGADNTFIGYQAGKGTTSGYANVVVGSQAYNNSSSGTSSTGFQNVCIGTYAGNAANSKTQAVLVGTDAQSQGGGTAPIAVGHASRAGSKSVAIGYTANAANNSLHIAWGGNAPSVWAGQITGNSSGHVAVTNDFNARRFVETAANAFNTSLAPSSGTLTVDSSAGNVVLGALSASVTTWAFTNVPTDNSRVTTVSAVIAGNTSYTYGSACSVNGSAVATGVQWFGGTAPTPSSTTDVLTFAIVRDSAGTIRVLGSAQTIDSVIGSASAGIDGAGSANYLSKWTDANTIANSAVFESGGNVGIGTASPSTRLEIANTTGAVANQIISNFSAGGTTSGLEFRKSRGASIGTNTIVQAGDMLGWIGFSGANGTGYDYACSIIGESDGTPGASNDMPGRLVFRTTSDGSNSAIERMRIDSNGTVSISNVANGLAALDVQSTSFNAVHARFPGRFVVGSALQSYPTIGYNCIPTNTAGGTTFQKITTDLSWMINLGNNNQMSFQYAASAAGGTNFVPVTAMAIDNTGSVLIRGTANSTNFTTQGTAAIKVSYSHSAEYGMTFRGASGDGTPIAFANSSNAWVGSIGTSATTTSYYTSSDYRLKENVLPINSALNKISLLKPSVWTWKNGQTQGQGFLAHELAEVLPDAVNGQKDAVDSEGNPVYQSVDYSKLTPLLAAALKELSAKVDALQAEKEALEARIAALENN